jgi:hypothetical protein
VDPARSRLRIGRRFRGPPGIANGGFASGSLAALLGGTVDVEVSLHVPTPEEARAAAGRGAYYGDPLLPDCFVCGPARAPGDGLRIFPGPVSRRSVWAAPWTPDLSVGGPDGRVRDEVVWLLGRDGRKLAAGSALLGPDGEVLTAARALWVTVARTAGGSG